RTHTHIRRLWFSDATRKYRLREATQVSGTARTMAGPGALFMAELPGANHRRWRLHSDSSGYGISRKGGVMATAAFVSNLTSTHRLTLAEIDAAVSACLGPTRVLGNAQPACFNRQIAMYLAKHLGRWSTTVIGRFYNGRDHSTVCHGIQRIEALRESDPDVDALLTELRQQLFHEDDGASN